VIDHEMDGWGSVPGMDRNFSSDYLLLADGTENFFGIIFGGRRSRSLTSI
jgi:hypothetical protein